MNKQYTIQKDTKKALITTTSFVEDGVTFTQATAIIFVGWTDTSDGVALRSKTFDTTKKMNVTKKAHNWAMASM